jgi:lysophospholipase L1-like esterase
VANGNNADAFLWWQGEADAITGQTPLYQAALANLVQRVRTAAGRPDMRVLVVGLADAPNAETRQEYADLRQAQQAFVAADGHAVYVSAEGLPLLSPPVPAYHLSAAGYAAMGQRIADALR